MKRIDSFRVSQSGFSLIELMISLVIGLIVVGSAFGIFLANRRTYSTSESLGRIQENARTAFELMARDIREAGGTPCDTSFPTASMLNGGGAWWNDIHSGIHGDPAASPTSSDKLSLVSATTSGAIIDAKTLATSNSLHVTTRTELDAGDVMLVCDFQCGTIFQMTSPAKLTGAGALVHDAGAAPAPGNSNAALACSSDPTNSAPQAFRLGGEVAKLQSVQWTVGANTHGGSSLYRTVYKAGLAQPADEIADGVQRMTLRYLVKGQSAYADATTVADWSLVTAVQVQLSLQGTNEKVGTNQQVLSRILSHTVAIRSRDNLQDLP